MVPRIILLREGTEDTHGKAQLIANINACENIGGMIRTTLGPRGMDKLIHQTEEKVTISNDGATILKLLDITHPAASLLVDIAKSQDAEIGDGTTTVVILACEFLKSVKPFIEEGVHPQIIMRSFRIAAQLSAQIIKDLQYDLQSKSPAEKREMLVKVARTAMNSKLIASHQAMFAEMVVDAVQILDQDLREDMIGIKQIPGGAMEDSFLVRGVAFKKCFSYAGFEQQPKKLLKPKILCLNLELELRNENLKAEVRITDPSAFQSIVNAEWKIIFDKLEACVQSGATVVLSRLAIGDLATQYFADRNIFCAGRVTQEDLQRTCEATDAHIQTTVTNLQPSCLGECDVLEECQIGAERYNIFTGCPKSHTATIVLRGGATQFIEETERSLHDAIMVVRRAMKHSAIVAGAGAIELEISKRLREFALTIHGKQQLLIEAFANSLETIPKQLAQNAGFDATEIVDLVRQKHYQGIKWAGVDIFNETWCDAFDKCIWEPSLIKINAIAAATEAACLILNVDETIRNPQSEQPQPGPGMRGQRGGGMGMRGRGRRGMRGRGRF